MGWNHESFSFVVVASLLSESSPHLFPASPIPVPPQCGQTPPSAWGQRKSRANSMCSCSLAKRPWRLELLNAMGFSARPQTVFSHYTSAQSHPGGDQGMPSWKITRNTWTLGTTVGVPRWRLWPIFPHPTIQGQEYSSGWESAQPASSWVQPELQDPPRGTHKGPGSGMLKAGSFSGFQKDAWHWTEPFPSQPHPYPSTSNSDPGLWEDTEEGAPALKKSPECRESVPDPHKPGWQVLRQDVQGAWGCRAAARATVPWVTPCTGGET